jgi:DNA-directed RNA polymerase specialized sigma24 family protein
MPLPLPRPTAPDAELLTRFSAGDEAAFAELVRRHGPLVYAAARRRLPDPADAADVFQATFLVPVQRQGKLTGPVGPFLYRVAALTTRNLRRKNARRLARRRPLFDPPARPGGGPEVDDLLLTLPERDRAAVVLCHLRGYSRREAAAKLGLPEGTLSSALSRALAKLRQTLTEPPAAGLPAGLAAATVGTATAVRAATLAAAGPQVMSLTRGALRMFWVKKLTAAGVLTAGLLGSGLAVGLAQKPAADPPPAAPADPGPGVDELDRLRKLAAEAERQADAARERATAQAAALRAATEAATVLDALNLLQVRDRPADKPVQVWVARPAAGGEQVLPVDWVGITQKGVTATNYHLQPGDRVHVRFSPPPGR